MSEDPRRTQPFCTPRCFRECQCTRWPDMVDRWGNPVNHGVGGSSPLLSYIEKILALGPIAHWPMNEAAGVVCEDIAGHDFDGAYTDVVLGEPGIGDGETSAYFDGDGCVNNVYSNALMTNPNCHAWAGRGDFEEMAGVNDFDGWSEQVGDGAIVDEGVIVHGGSHACKITSGATANSYIQQWIAPTPGVTYNLSMWTRGDGVNAGRYEVKDATHGWADLIPLTSTGITGAVYTEVTNTWTCPAGTIDVAVRLYGPAAAGGIAYFDDCWQTPQTGDGWNYDQGSFGIWAKVHDVGMWTDGNAYVILQAQFDDTDKFRIRKDIINSNLFVDYFAQNISSARVTVTNTIDWFAVMFTWDKAADEVKVYFNGAQQGATINGLGQFNAACMYSNIGALHAAPPDTEWYGWLAHAVLWDRALTPAEALAFATV